MLATLSSSVELSLLSMTPKGSEECTPHLVCAYMAPSLLPMLDAGPRHHVTPPHGVEIHVCSSGHSHA